MIFSNLEMFLMRRLLCILLILMHIVEINICMYFIFWKIILNHENVLLASLLHPADLDALFWKTLKNVEHMPYLIFVYWGLIFFSWLRFFTKGTNKSSALVALMSNIRYDRCPMFCFFVIVMFKFCQLNTKCQIEADQWHRWWHSHILQWNDWRVCFNETLFHYSPM